MARLGTRGAIARQLAYWSIDAIIGAPARAGVRRCARALGGNEDRAGIRAEADARGEADRLSFVRDERARAGDLGAQRVLDALVAPTRDRSEHVPHGVSRVRVTWTRYALRLNVIRAEEEGRYQRAAARASSTCSMSSARRRFDEALATERRRIQNARRRLPATRTPSAFGSRSSPERSGRGIR